MEFNKLMEQAYGVVNDKGFDFKQHALQELLTASEVAEALENIDIRDSSPEIFQVYQTFMQLMYELEVLRKEMPLTDNSKITNKRMYAEEKADQVIRIMTKCYADGIDLQREIQIKLEKNKQRPYLHGKKF